MLNKFINVLAIAINKNYVADLAVVSTIWGSEM